MERRNTDPAGEAEAVGVAVLRVLRSIERATWAQAVGAGVVVRCAAFGAAGHLAHPHQFTRQPPQPLAEDHGRDTDMVCHFASCGTFPMHGDCTAQLGSVYGSAVVRGGWWRRMPRMLPVEEAGGCGARDTRRCCCGGSVRTWWASGGFGFADFPFHLGEKHLGAFVFGQRDRLSAFQR